MFANLTRTRLVQLYPTNIGLTLEVFEIIAVIMIVLRFILHHKATFTTWFGSFVFEFLLLFLFLVISLGKWACNNEPFIHSLAVAVKRHNLICFFVTTDVALYQILFIEHQAVHPFTLLLIFLCSFLCLCFLTVFHIDHLFRSTLSAS